MSTPSTTSTLPSPDLIEAARAAVTAAGRIGTVDVLDPDGITHTIPVAIVHAAGAFRVDVMKDVIAEAERRFAGPIRRAGSVELGSLADFVAYVNRFKLPHAVAFAPLNPPGVTAIFDYHPASGEADELLPAAAWCADRASYRCPLSRQWKLWTEYEGKAQHQIPFGDFIEANQLDLSTKEGFAPATKMLEVARNLVIHSAGKFERRIDPTTGTGTLIAKDEHSEASTKIPKSFALAIPVFEGDETHYVVEALVRFAMVDGRPVFSYLLQNKEQVFETAVAALRKQVTDGCGIPVFVGNPPAAAR